MNTLKMSMLNHAAVEALCSATYLENYLDCLDALPDDLQRNVSQMRELDVQYNDLLRDVEHYRCNYQKESDPVMKKRAVLQIQRALLKCQELGDDKLQVVSQIIENIENRSRQLEQDLENLDPAANREIPEPPEKEIKEPIPVAHTPVVTIAPPPTTVKPVKEVVEKPERQGHKRQRRQRTHHDSVTSKEEEKKVTKEEKEKPKKKKKRKTKEKKEQSPLDQPIDPDEPTYCLCDQVSYGEMIGCDNDNCPIEWFHFNCVYLTTKPKGKWFCPKCRGDRPNVKRADLK